jgi:hypothetical protein
MDKVKTILGNSQENGAITIEANIELPANSENDPEHIVSIANELYPLIAGQKTVPLNPKSSFGMPE